MPYPNYPPSTTGSVTYPYSPYAGVYDAGLRYPPIPNPNFSPEGNFGQIKAKVIRSIDEVPAQEVPMDGIGAIFLTQDRHYVYTKNWAPDGTIKTQRYILDETPESTDALDDVSSELASIKDRLAKLEQLNDKRPPRRSQKEVTTDDA